MSSIRPTPKQRGKDVGRLERVIAKAVALSPSARWQSAGELLEAIDAASSSRVSRAAARREPGGGGPLPTTATRSWNARRQTLTIVGAGGLTILAAFAVLFGTLGGDPSRVSGPAEELALAPSNRGSGGGALRRLAFGSAVTDPWIIPISAPDRSADAALLASCTPAAAPPRRSRASHALTEATPPEAAAAAPAPICSMTLNSVPWSEVWIDGAATGQHTPFVDYPIACGRHRVEFKRPDLRMDQLESVVVKPNEPFKRRFTLAEGSE
jgi:hypothetical protein